jgi:hypothetical protein
MGRSWDGAPPELKQMTEADVDRCLASGMLLPSRPGINSHNIQRGGYLGNLMLTLLSSRPGINSRAPLLDMAELQMAEQLTRTLSLTHTCTHAHTHTHTHTHAHTHFQAFMTMIHLTPPKNSKHILRQNTNYTWRSSFFGNVRTMPQLLPAQNQKTKWESTRLHTQDILRQRTHAQNV